MIGNRFDPLAKVTRPTSRVSEALNRILGIFDDDTQIEEIILADSSRFVVRRGQLPQQINIELLVSVYEVIRSLAEAQSSRIDPICPSAGGQTGMQRHRWHALVPPAVDDGPILTIRRNQMASVVLSDFVWQFDVQTSLNRALCDRVPIIISGVAGSGKTTLLSAILKKFCGARRAVLVEHYPEIHIASPYWTRLAERHRDIQGRGGVSLDFLFRESLRLRPDVLVFGEIRSQEATHLLHAMLSGHQVLATIHAGSAAAIRARLSSLLSNANRVVLEKMNLLGIHINSLENQFEVTSLES